MRARALLAMTAIIAVGATTTAADAAPKKRKPKPPPPACNLVVDPTGDVSNKFQGVDAFPSDGGLDLVGADVASGAKTVTAVIRLAAEPGTSTAYMKRYIAQFNVAGQKYPMILAGAVSATGDKTFSFGWNEAGATGGSSYKYSSVPVTGKIDGKVITITALLSDIASEANLGPIKNGSKISGITVTANRRLPGVAQAPGIVYVADDAMGKTAYTAGSPSCLKPA